MGKISRMKRVRREKQGSLLDRFWEDADGIHTASYVPGEPPPGASDRMTEEFQKRIRKSPMWKQMVDQFGETEAERLLKQCKTDIR